MFYTSGAELQHTNSKIFIIYTRQKKMGMLKLVDRSRLGRGEVNSYKFESYYPYKQYKRITIELNKNTIKIYKF